MGEVVPLQDPGNYKRVEERVRKLLKDGDLEILPHAAKRMAERQLETTDIQHVIRFGTVIDHSKPGEFWRYVIEGKTVEGKKARVVVEIDGSLIVVTATKLRESGGKR